MGVTRDPFAFFGEPVEAGEKKLFFLDSSALSKLYLRENGSEDIQRLVGDRKIGFHPNVKLCVSRMAFPETLSAIRKQNNLGAITEAETVRLWGEVFQDFLSSRSPYTIYDTTEAVAGHAAMIVMRHGLRAYDAVHLCTALRIRAADEEGRELVFVSADRRLNNVAREERFTVYDPTEVAPAAN
ncbi:MAG TPA: type II toxin-antitoxin system VapC family toxin [Longimicrobium sp.]|jgi:predicted nucleic acid-binding protein